MNRLEHIDQAITLWINSFHSPLTDQFWIFLSDVRIWFLAYGIIIVMMFVRLGWKKGVVVLLSCILAVVLADQISYHIKEGVMRLRPCYTTWMLENGLHWPLPRYSFFGFFSGHASNAFAFIACSLTGFRSNDSRHRYQAYMLAGYVWAALVALSRIMMAAHYFGDVLVGICFGLLVGYGLGFLSRAIIVKARL